MPCNRLIYAMFAMVKKEDQDEDLVFVLAFIRPLPSLFPRSRLRCSSLGVVIVEMFEQLFAHGLSSVRQLALRAPKPV